MNQELVQEIENKITTMINNVHTALPGTIQTFDPSTCTATVLPTGSYITPNKKEMAYPAIPGTPVIIPQYEGQNAVIAFPIKPGDGCLILFSEQQLDYFLYGASSSELHHDMSNAIAIVGLFNVASTAIQEACEENAIVIAKKETRIKIFDDEVRVQTEKVNIEASEVTVQSSEALVNTNLAQLNASQLKVNAGYIDVLGEVKVDGNVEVTKKLKVKQLVPASCTLK